MANDTERPVIRVLEHIRANPAGDLSLDALAEVAAMSRSRWHRVVRTMTNETAAQTVQRMRMHRAAMALLTSGAAIEQVARAVGYPDTTSFARACRQVYGMPPSTFRMRGALRPFHPTSRKDETQMHPVTIRTDPARRLAALRHKGRYTLIGATFEKLGAMLTSRGLHDDSLLMIAVFCDDPSPKRPSAGSRNSMPSRRRPEGRHLVAAPNCDAPMPPRSSTIRSAGWRCNSPRSQANPRWPQQSDTP